MKTISESNLSRTVAAIRLAVVLYYVITLTACNPSPSPLTPTTTPIPRAIATLTHTPIRVPSTPGWKSYHNEDYTFAFDYPSEVPLIGSEKGPFEIRVYLDAEHSFSISATHDYLPADVNYFLDNAPTGQRSLGEYTWQTYELPEGYCDASGCSSPIYALQIEVQQVLYIVVFYDQATMTPLQEQILSTFRILN